VVVLAYSSSYLGGRGREDLHPKPAGQKHQTQRRRKLCYLQVNGWNFMLSEVSQAQNTKVAYFLSYVEARPLS
jgi:hypothetical protein